MAAELVQSSELDAYLSGDSDAALVAAEAAVRSYCGWHVAPSKAETVTVRGEGEPALLVPSLHVTGVTEVRVDGKVVDDVSWYAHGALYSQRGYGRWCGRVEVDMTHGYEANSPAGEVLRSTILAVAARAIASPSGVVRSQVGQISETYSQTGSNQAGGVVLLDNEKAALDPYLLPPRP